jgi:hypothetical protein
VTFQPTTTVDVQAPASTAVDGFGDPVEGWTPVADNQPAAYAERRKRVWDPVTSRAGTVTWGEALLPAHVQVAVGHRLLDRTSGRVHHVTHVQRPQNLVIPGGFLRVELEDPSPS